MKCSICSAELNETDLYCASCGDKFALNAQKEKLDAVLENGKDTIRQQAHNPLFLIASLCFTLVFVFKVISMVTGGIFGIITGILPFVFMLITVIGMWRAYAAKPGANISGALRSASIYDAYQRVMYTISIVLVCIVGAFTLIIMITDSAKFISAFSEASSDLGGEAAKVAIVPILIVVAVFAVIITVLSVLRSVYANRRAYFCSLAEAAEKGSTGIRKAPVVGSYVIGGYYVLSTVISIVAVSLLTSLINKFLSALLGSEVDGLSEIVGLLFAGSIISNLPTLLLGLYYILSAAWASRIYAAKRANDAIIAKERDEYARINRETDNAIQRKSLERKQEEDRRREEERKAEAEKHAQELKAQQELQAQQQKMMQMMMEQMMKNGQLPMQDLATPEAQPEAQPEASAVPAE